jgi:hypothetical protein
MVYLLAVVVFGIVFAGMALGVIFKNRPIQGSCGGLGNFRDSDGTPWCEGCSEPCGELKRELKRAGYSAERIAELVPSNPDCDHHAGG